MHQGDFCHCSGCGTVARLLSDSISRSSFIAAAAAAGAGAALAPYAGMAESESSNSITVYIAKSVVTMEGEERATAVAISGKKIVGVGTLDEVVRTLKPGSYVVDRRFENRVIFPGFIEQHLHPLLGSLSTAAVIISIEDWNVPGNVSKKARDHAEYVARLKAAIADMHAAPAEEVLFTWGYHQDFHGNVYRPELDAMSSERPIVTWHRSCHELILNTAALRKYGITEASIAGHGLASTQANFAKGHFYEKGLQLVLAPVGKDVATPARLKTGIQRVKAFLRSTGVTTICEPGTQMSRPIQEFWEATLSGDDVGFRTYFIADGRALYDKYKSDLGELVPATHAFASWGKGNVAWLPRQVKLFADGAIFSLLMQLQQPYLDGHKGEWIAEPSEYEAAFKTYWDAGYHIHTHVNGDRGLQMVIETLAANMKAAPRLDHRFTVVHFAVSTDAQVKRLAELGAIISANPYYVSALADKYSKIGLGPERADSMARLGSAVRNNISISLHSDMPMAPADPLFLASCAVNRRTVSGRTADASQQITAMKALRAVTIEAAYSLGLEDEIGSIKVGKSADFTILDANPLAGDPEKLADVRVVGTVFGGKVFSPDLAYAGALSGAARDLSDARGAVSRSALDSTVG